MRNNKITTLQDSEAENQSSRVVPSIANSHLNFNLLLASGVSLFFSGFAFGITSLSLDVDKIFHENRNQTSFTKNLGEDGRHGFALAISASTFLATFLMARRYLKKIDRQNNDQVDGPQIRAEIGFSDFYRGNLSPSNSFQSENSSPRSIFAQNNSR